MTMLTVNVSPAELDSTDPRRVVVSLTPEQVRDLTARGVIAGGMIPKTETALLALEQGVRAVVILDGRIPNACLLELFTDHGAGSLIRSTEPRIKPRGE
jgi:acetylglutamate kinase